MNTKYDLTKRIGKTLGAGALAVSLAACNSMGPTRPDVLGSFNPERLGKGATVGSALSNYVDKASVMDAAETNSLFDL